jgi:hypothetical protein
MAIAAGMNDHTFTFWMTMLGAAVTGVVTVFGVWLGASLALRHDRAAKRAEHQRASVSYLSRRVLTAGDVLTVADIAEVHSAGEALYDDVLQAEGWDAPDDIVDAIFAAATAMEELPDDDAEKWRLATYLAVVIDCLWSVRKRQTYHIPVWSEWVAPPRQST